MLSLRPSQPPIQCVYLAVSPVFGRDMVDVLIAFPFQTEDVVCVSDLMVTCFEFSSRKKVNPHTFIPLVTNILQIPGELYHL